MVRHSIRLVIVSLLVIGVMGVVSVIGGSSSSFAQGVPKAVIEEPIHDFGTLYRGAHVSTSFRIENQGDAELVLKRVSSNCACLVTEFEERIPPSGSGEIKAELDTLIVQGPVSSFIQVSTNDPDNPTLQLTVKATVENIISVEPGYFDYSVVEGFRGRAAIGQLLWSPDGAPFKITRIEPPFPYLSVTYREATPEERKRAGKQAEGDGPFYWVEGVLANDAPVGPLAGFVKIYVDHPKQSVVPLPISGFMRPVFAVTPNQVHFGTIALVDDEPLQQEFFIKNFATETIPITKVDTDIEGVQVELHEQQQGRTWRMTLTIPTSMPKGPFAGSLNLHTESDRAPLVTVPISATLR